MKILVNNKREEFLGQFKGNAWGREIQKIIFFRVSNVGKKSFPIPQKSNRAFLLFLFLQKGAIIKTRKGSKLRHGNLNLPYIEIFNTILFIWKICFAVFSLCILLEKQKRE